MWNITKIHSSYDKIGISILIWHRAIVHFMYIKPLWWLITVQNEHEQNPLIHLRYSTTNIQNLGCNGHKCYILAQSQGMFNMLQVPIVVDYCTKYEQNQLILFWDIVTNIKWRKNIGIITQSWHRSKRYSMCIGNTWYLITVPNMNTINPFLFEISQ